LLGGNPFFVYAEFISESLYFNLFHKKQVVRTLFWSFVLLWFFGVMLFHNFEQNKVFATD
jgi:Trk-type K+ transport system membrane component